MYSSITTISYTLLVVFSSFPRYPDLNFFNGGDGEAGLGGLLLLLLSHLPTHLDDQSEGGAVLCLVQEQLYLGGMAHHHRDHRWREEVVCEREGR